MAFIYSYLLPLVRAYFEPRCFQLFACMPFIIILSIKGGYVIALIYISLLFWLSMLLCHIFYNKFKIRHKTNSVQQLFPGFLANSTESALYLVCDTMIFS